MTETHAAARVITPPPRDPVRFFRPLPLRSRAQVLAAFQDQIEGFGTASLAMNRLLCLGVGTLWLIYLLTAGIRPTSWLDSSFMAAFLMLAALTALTPLWNIRIVYRIMLILCPAVFALALSLHIGFLLLTGDSPLTTLRLGNHCGLPMVMLAAVMPGWWVSPMILLIMGSAAATNYNLVAAPPFEQFVGALHAILLLFPYVVFLRGGQRAAEGIDRLATRSLRLSLDAGQQSVLHEYRTRFLGFIHDRVLTYLHALNRSVISIKTPRPTFEGLDQMQSIMPLGLVLEGWETTFMKVNPRLKLTIPKDFPEDATVPTVPAQVMAEALMEALSNTVEHAPNADHCCDVELIFAGKTLTGINVTVTDNGPGFELDAIPADRAGVKIAMVGRMASISGGYADVESVPGRGTRVTVGWSHVPADETHRSVPIPTMYELLSIDRLLHPACAFTVLAFVVLLSSTAWGVTNWGPYSLAMFAVVIAVVALFQGRQYRLDANWAWLTAGAIVVFMVCASVSVEAALPHWPVVWFPWVFVLLCSYLMMRGQPLIGWLAFGVALAAFTGLYLSGFTPQEHGPIDVILQSPLLIASTMMPALARRATRQFPSVVREYSAENIASGLALVRSTFMDESVRWMDYQLDEVANPGLTTEQRGHFARLLERRLRDCIRCPLFDTAMVSASVWDARARGATVTLLDDRSSNTAADVHPSHEDLVDALVEALQTLEDGGTLTARISPAGRSTYASLLWSATPDAEPQRMRF